MQSWKYSSACEKCLFFKYCSFEQSYHREVHWSSSSTRTTTGGGESEIPSLVAVSSSPISKASLLAAAATGGCWVLLVTFLGPNGVFRIL